VTKEPWYVPISEPYVPDWDDWAKNFNSTWSIWSGMLKKVRQEH
jgi:hypothetical protein